MRFKLGLLIGFGLGWLTGKDVLLTFFQGLRKSTASSGGGSGNLSSLTGTSTGTGIGSSTGSSGSATSSSTSPGSTTGASGSATNGDSASKPAPAKARTEGAG